MKAIFVSMLLIILMKSNAQETLKVNPALQEKYLMEEMGKFYIGMPADSFFAAAKINNTGDISYTKEISSDHAVSITYQCTKDILYEMYVDYKPTFDLSEYLEKKLGPTNYDNHGISSWKIKLADGLTLLIWKYKQKYCIGDFRQFDY